MSSWWKSQRLEQAAQRHRIIRRRWADPTAIRQPRNPADPIQAARIEAAAAKRARRAEKLTVNMKRTVANSAHFGFLYEAHDERVYGIPDRLNPFRIAL